MKFYIKSRFCESLARRKGYPVSGICRISNNKVKEISGGGTLQNIRGFSLIELLVVVSIASLLTIIAVPSIKGICGASGLTGAGSIAASLLDSARREAITKNTCVAVVVITDTRYPQAAYRTFTILALGMPSDGSAPTTSDWKQVCPWQSLPSGSILDSASTFLTSPATFTPALPDLKFAGNTFSSSGYAYQVFLPSGRLSAPPSPCALSFIQGFYTSGAPTYISPNNYYNLTLNDATGRLKISRP